MPSLTRHIVKKDFRYLWPFLATWWAILVAEALYTAHSFLRLFALPFKSPYDFTRPADNATQNVWFFLSVDFVLLVFVVNEVIKSDSPIDERAVWRTRPVGWPRLLLAKMFFIGIACFLVPGAIETIQRLYVGFGWRYCLIALAQFALNQSACMTVVILAAVLFRRTAAGLLTFVIAGVVGYVAVMELIKIGDYRWVLSRAYEGGSSSNWIYLGLPLATAFAVIALVYARQRRRLGAFMLILSLLPIWPLTIFLAENHVYHNYLNLNDGPIIHEVQMTLTLTSHAEKGTDHWTASKKEAEGWQTFADLTTPRGPALQGKAFQMRFVTSQLQWPGEKNVRKGISGEGLGDFHNIPGVVAEAGYGRMAWSQNENWRDIEFIFLTNPEFQRAQHEPARWSGTARFTTFHLVRVLDVPLKENAAWWAGTRSRIVPGFGPDEHHNVVISLEDASAWYMPVFSPHNAVYDFDSVFLLYNPKTQESIQAQPPFGEGLTSVSYFDFNWRQLGFSFNGKTDTTGRLLSAQPGNQEIANWLADAHLVELHLEHEGDFQCPVTIDPFLVPADAGPAAPIPPSLP